VPSSNTTMETAIPAILRARETVEPERFTFHFARMRMSASECTAFQILERLDLRAVAPNAGTLLSERYGAGAKRGRAA